MENTMHESLFIPSKAPILEDQSARLLLLTAADSSHLSHIAMLEPELFTYTLMVPNSSESLKHFISDALSEYKKKNAIPFIVYDKHFKEFAGTTRFYDINFNHQSIAIGFTWFGKKFHGTGLNKHCKYLMLQFAFEQLGMERVEFRADNNNERSIAAMKSIGCKVEGVIRSHMPNNSGGRRDSIVLSILKEEWYDHVKKELQAKL